jgi:hypothetical protein
MPYELTSTPLPSPLSLPASHMGKCGNSEESGDHAQLHHQHRTHRRYGTWTHCCISCSHCRYALLLPYHITHCHMQQSSHHFGQVTRLRSIIFPIHSRRIDNSSLSFTTLLSPATPPSSHVLQINNSPPLLSLVLTCMLVPLPNTSSFTALPLPPCPSLSPLIQVLCSGPPS